MDAFFVISGGDGSTGDTGEEVKDGLNENFDIIQREFTNRRTMTGIGAVTQDDDNALIILNSATPFDVTLDQLAEGTKISFYNIGAGAVTFTNGAGVTVVGNPVLPGASGTTYPTAFINYESLTSPRVISGGSTGGGGGTGDVVGPASATNNAIVLFDGTTGELIKDSAKTISIDGTLGSNSDNLIPTEKAVKTYADALSVGGVSDANETTKGISEEATDAETLAGTATGGTSAKLFVTPAKLATLRARRTARNAVALVSTTLTLDWLTEDEKVFDLTTTLANGTTPSITIAFSGSNMLMGKLFMRVTGQIAITMPSACVMDVFEESIGRWVSSTNVLTILGATASPFYMTFEKDGAGNIWVHVSNRGV